MSKGNAKIHTKKTQCRKPDNFWHGVDWQMFPVIIRKRCDKVLSACHRGKNVLRITPGLLQAGEITSLHFFSVHSFVFVFRFAYYIFSSGPRGKIYFWDGSFELNSHQDPVQTTREIISRENAALFLRSDLPSTLNCYVAFRRPPSTRRNLKRVFK